MKLPGVGRKTAKKELAKILPKKYWTDTNRLFVSIGRKFRTKKKLEEFMKKSKLV